MEISHVISPAVIIHHVSQDCNDEITMATSNVVSRSFSRSKEASPLLQPCVAALCRAKAKGPRVVFLQRPIDWHLM